MSTTARTSMAPKDRMCYTKKRYETRHEAEAAVVRTQPLTLKTLRVYECPFGKHWHMTSKPDRKVSA